MNEHIEDLIEDMFDFSIEREYLFEKRYGFTFVMRRDIATFNDQMSSAEIKPVGIIYEENGEYYYAPLYGEGEIDDIIQEFVKEI